MRVHYTAKLLLRMSLFELIIRISPDTALAVRLCPRLKTAPECVAFSTHWMEYTSTISAFQNGRAWEQGQVKTTRSILFTSHSQTLSCLLRRLELLPHVGIKRYLDVMRQK